MRLSNLLPVLCCVAQLVRAQAGGPCLVYGPDVPTPQHPSTDPTVKAALANVREAIESGTRNNVSTPYGPIDTPNAANFVDIFSNHEPGSLFTYHNTPPVLRNSSQGTTEFDDNSIDRLGSISKLLTVYTYLLTAGDRSWNTPNTELIPELADADKANTGNAINTVDWESITPGALASHLAGVGRLHTQSAATDAIIGQPGIWPDADQFEQKQCGLEGYLSIPCNRTQIFANFLARPPVVPPFQTPIYSNDAFTILAYALESVTNTSLTTLFNTHLTTLHSLNSTSPSPPTGAAISRAVIPDGNSKAHFLDNPAILAPSGAATQLYPTCRSSAAPSSTQHTSTQQALTRRWFKPQAFAADPRGARIGDISRYSNLVLYIPECGIGATILTAVTTETGLAARFNLADIIISEMYSALEAAARREAHSSFVGVYRDESVDMDKATGMTAMEVGMDDFGGLNLVSWIQNGSDVRGRYILDSRLDASTGPTVFTRLLPTGLVERGGDGATQAVGFRLVAGESVKDVKTRPASSLCFEWVAVDRVGYGRFGVDSLVFVVGKDGDGRAGGVEVPAFGMRLVRVGGRWGGGWGG